MKALVLVYGDVHGVGFRSYCQRLAQELGLKGLCRNEPNSCVRGFLDGEKTAIEKFVDTVKKIRSSGFFGPHVDKVLMFKEGENGFQPAWHAYSGFEIDY